MSLSKLLKGKEISGIIEEIADVENVIEQFRQLAKVFDNKALEKIDKIKDEKIERTLERMTSGYYTPEDKLTEAVCSKKETIKEVLEGASGC